MTDLPIQHILPQVFESLDGGSRLIVQAPPGAGKSTLLPLHLLNANWLKDKQIWLLEPRRLAADMVARRLASSLGEELGLSIGLMTGEFSKVAKSNKLVVMTEGILAQRLIQENDIPQCAAIVFDEFHERNVQTDLGLALAVQCQDYLRDDLKLILMSATLDTNKLTQALDASVVTSEGRCFDVQVHYLAAKLIQNRPANLSQQISQAINLALKADDGDILVFLPGVKEIRQCQDNLSQSYQNEIDQTLLIVPLHGQLNWQQQQHAINKSDKRKIILATDIAKTSLTLEGVTVVIDSGLERQSQFNSRLAMDELVTVKASKASIIQRSGRAGRTQAGSCYRLFSEEDFLARPDFSDKAIYLCDSAQLALSLAAWGSLDLDDYFLLDLPETRRWQNSLELLDQLEITQDQTLSPHGKSLSKMALHPRLSHMIIKAHEMQLGYTACFVAAILSEGDPLHFDMRDGNNSDLQVRLQLFELHKLPQQFEHGQVKHKVAQRIIKLAHKLCKQLAISKSTQLIEADNAGLLIMLAYPDRLAQLRGQGYRLRNGQGCRLLPEDAIKSSDFLAIAHMSLNKSNYQQSSQSYVRLGALVSIKEIDRLFKDQVEQVSTGKLNEKNNLITLKQTRLGALILDEKTQPASEEDKKAYSLQMVKEKGLKALPLSEQHLDLLARLNLAHECFPDIYPDFSEAALINDVDTWLLPFLATSTLAKIDYKQAWLSRLDWAVQSQLNEAFPTHFKLPTGRDASIDYSQLPPVVRAKLQECFGLLQSPTLANAKVTLNLHLLSPAQKPLAMTQDLAFFWKEAYPQVRKENRGRYAKHPWPEDPLIATASQFTKKRINESK